MPFSKFPTWLKYKNLYSIQQKKNGAAAWLTLFPRDHVWADIFTIGKPFLPLFYHSLSIREYKWEMLSSYMICLPGHSDWFKYACDQDIGTSSFLVSSAVQCNISQNRGFPFLSFLSFLQKMMVEAWKVIILTINQPLTLDILMLYFCYA